MEKCCWGWAAGGLCRDRRPRRRGVDAPAPPWAPGLLALSHEWLWRLVASLSSRAPSLMAACLGLPEVASHALCCPRRQSCRVRQLCSSSQSESLGADGNHKLWYLLGPQPQCQEHVASPSLLCPITPSQWAEPCTAAGCSHLLGTLWVAQSLSIHVGQDGVTLSGSCYCREYGGVQAVAKLLRRPCFRKFAPWFVAEMTFLFSGIACGFTKVV